uniref:Uncharacterized protein n=1 Tax=Anguilla anguilla TaxID=7936 RepID=A0A0E9P8A3_ANGAN
MLFLFLRSKDNITCEESRSVSNSGRSF